MSDRNKIRALIGTSVLGNPVVLATDDADVAALCAQVSDSAEDVGLLDKQDCPAPGLYLWEGTSRLEPVGAPWDGDGPTSYSTARSARSGPRKSPPSTPCGRPRSRSPSRSPANATAPAVPITSSTTTRSATTTAWTADPPRRGRIHTCHRPNASSPATPSTTCST
jgi:hypothetical protein